MSDSSLDQSIRSLTDSDTKTLSQKSLKLGAECGELQEKALAYDGADGASDRFVTFDGILDEVADVILVARSIAHSIGATNDDLERVLKAKVVHWAEKQHRQGTGKYPFEFHVTVDAASSVTQFREHCALIGVKPILLDLQTKQKGTIKDLMTSSTMVGTNTEARVELNRIVEELTARGYNVLRKKVETVPWHPAAPQKARDPNPPDTYFECHIGVMIRDALSIDKLPELLSHYHNVHLSSNAFKVQKDGTEVRMVTLRDYVTNATTFKHMVESLSTMIVSFGWDIEKPIIEFAIYDSKISHDAEWLEG